MESNNSAAEAAGLWVESREACNDAAADMMAIGVPRRPYDAVVEAGPPADPIPFPTPQIRRGRREEVHCYDPTSQTYDMKKNVLFRANPQEFEDGGSQAYWPVPNKACPDTIMGKIEFCIVLKQWKRRDDGNGTSSMDNHGNSNMIIFELTEEWVAIKVCYSHRMEDFRHRLVEDPLKEIAAMEIIGNNHPNVMGCRDVLFDGQSLNVVMSYCSSGDLWGLIFDSVGQQRGMTEPQARYWFRQIIAGVKHIHSVGICHRDLSPENVMMDGTGCLIIDMGMAIRIPYTADPNDPESLVTDISTAGRFNNQHMRRMIKRQGTCGKLSYMSPEIYRNEDPFDGEAVDVWTCGTILFCMLTGRNSYERPQLSDQIFYCMTRELEYLLRYWKVNLSQEGLHLLQNMLQVDPRMRLSLEEIEHHPWFAHADEPQNANGVEFQSSDMEFSLEHIKSEDFMNL